MSLIFTHSSASILGPVQIAMLIIIFIVMIGAMLAIYSVGLKAARQHEAESKAKRQDSEGSSR